MEGEEALLFGGALGADGSCQHAGHAGIFETAVDEVEPVGDGCGEVGALFGGEFEGHGGDGSDGIDRRDGWD